METGSAGLLANLLREVTIVLDHWIYALPLAVAVCAVGLGLGRGLGLPHIFRDDEQVFSPARCWRPPSDAPPPPPSRLPRGLQLLLASPAFWSGFGFIAAFGLFWMAIHSGGNRYCRAADGSRVFCPTTMFTPEHAPHAGWWMVLALALAAVLLVWMAWAELSRPLADFTRRDGATVRAELYRTALGCLLGGLFAAFAAALGELAPAGRALWGMAAPYLALLAFVLLRRSVLPCLALFSLIMGLILIGTLYPESWQSWTEICVIAAVAIIAVINRGWGRYRLPGFEGLYDADPVNPQEKADEAPGTPLIPPVAALDAWHAHRAATAPEDAPERPILVLLATSGGAYRAGFWTSLIMDHLVARSGAGGRWPGLAGDLRLITGASGGMVAGGYYVAMAAEDALAEGVTERISRDTWARMAAPEGDDRKHPIARDSLSPVVHRLASRDLLQLVTPWRPQSDRGRTLDAQWATLGRSFAALRDAEAAGRAPSIILSPMLVETGALALFSNLDLTALRRRGLPPNAKPGDENKSSVEVFRAFPGAHAAMDLATAVRLNATFPYVSPAISLPTRPDRRPVDAGYYDNYGIDLLTAYLQQEEIRDWILGHCAGVAVIQVRAFPSEVPTPTASGLQRAYQFLSSPVEGIFSARKASQMFRNDQQLALTRTRYAQAAGQDFLRVFNFEANSDVSMSWYLRCDEMRALDGLLRPPVAEDLVWGAEAIRQRGAASPVASGTPVPLPEVEAWAFARFTGGWPQLIDALQRRQPEALWAQFLHHRAKIAAEFDALAAFWDARARTQPDAAPPGEPQ